MKKIMSVFMAAMLLLGTIAGQSLAANAMIVRIADYGTSGSPVSTVTFYFDVLYIGNDVTGGARGSSFSVSVSTSASASAFQAAVVSALQAKATALGFTVAAGHSLIPSFTLQ